MKIPDHVKLEMTMAEIMAQQEASGFRFDMAAAERVRAEISVEFDELCKQIRSRFAFFPGKVFTPKRNDNKSGYRAGAPMTKLVEFNPTSRQHIAWALTTHRNALFTKKTDSGKPQVDEAVLSEIAERALSNDDMRLHDECQMFIRVLTVQKWLGQLSEGTNSWFNTIEEDGCIHHSCQLATVTGRNIHRSPNLGQVNSAPWARELFIPHPGMKMVGCDLEGLELRVLGHYLAPFDNSAFANVVVNGDIHQQNADRVGCSRKAVKNLTYAFMYGSGDQKLGHLWDPAASDAAKKSIGKDLRRKFLDAIPGLEPLIDAIKRKVKERGYLIGLDRRPIQCDAEFKSLNFLCQSAGACVSKRWVVISQQMLDECGLVYGTDYTRCAYVHDEQQLSVVPSETERVSRILEDAAVKAGEYYQFRVAITASSCVGNSWKETH
jgi:DNA polymerase I-like protein with 3'-5' exonuclease and polymerase domains